MPYVEIMDKAEENSVLSLWPTYCVLPSGFDEFSRSVSGDIFDGGTRMTLVHLMARLEGLRRFTRGALARCPAHVDRSPSLSVREAEDGRILLHCFAGCSVEEICKALGYRVADLFPQGPETRLNRGSFSPTKPCFDWEHSAWQLKFHAVLLWLRADAVLQAAQGLDTSNWSDTENDAAMQAVINARDDIARADLLEEVAFGIRARGLKEQNRAHHAHAA